VKFQISPPGHTWNGLVAHVPRGRFQQFSRKEPHTHPISGYLLMVVGQAQASHFLLARKLLSLSA
jgi:hypothetical protein